MAAINFPNSPVIGQEHIVGTIKYKWTGVYWQSIASLALANISDWPTAVSATEVGYLDGVTSAIQTQLNAKAALAGSTSQVFACSNLAFPATQVASADANTLDDYEEGTFTPIIEGTTVAGTGTYTTQFGWYTKIGNRVLYTLFINWTAHTGTGNILVKGLPFAPSAITNVYIATSIIPQDITFSNQIAAGIISNLSAVVPITISTGAAPAQIPMDTSGRFYISGHYHV